MSTIAGNTMKKAAIATSGPCIFSAALIVPLPTTVVAAIIMSIGRIK